MGNKFDMISAAESGSYNNLNLLNETFHVFSKSPASNVTTLGGARLKSGHTTTTSDVWADEIPAFFSAANQAKFDLFSTLAVKDDLCIFGGKVYQHNGEQFISLGTEDEVLVDGATFKKNNKDVIKYHKNRTAINLTADNNNGDGSNNLSAKIYDAATGSTNFVSQFISSTDKMVAGVPSLAYDATVVADGIKLAEGLTNDNDYICNAYAGVIQFNKARSSGVTVSAWEYIGEKLTTSISSIRQSIKDISDVTLKGVVASVTADENTAQKAGITVDDTIATTPVIKFTAGSVATGETKLVTGGDVKTYVDTTALAEGGSIAEYIENYVKDAITTDNGVIKDAIDSAISDATLADGQKIATTTDTSKLVTAEQVKEYVTENAQVTVTVGETEVTSTGFEFAGSTGADVSVAAEMDENGKVTYSATLSKATVGTDGAITNGSLAVSATDAKTIAKAEIEAAVEEGEVIDSRISEVIEASLNDTTTEGTIGKAINDVKTTANSAVQSVSRADGSSTLLTVNDGTDVTISLSTEVATKTDAATAASDAIATSLADTTTTGTIGKAIADAKKAGTDAATAADGKVADVTVDGTSIVSGDAGSKKAALTTTKVAAITPSVDSASTALATEASVAKALASITSVGVSYEVLGDNVKHESVDAPVKGRIYLEKDETNAEAGVYIEWMYTEKGWEQIGSTKTDHSTYASTITINGSPKTVANSSVDLGSFASSVADGTVTGTVSTTGELELTIDDATTSQKGAVQLTDTYTATDDTNAATGKSIAAAIDTLDAEKSVNGITVTQENGVITSVTEELITATVPAGTTSVDGNVAYVGVMDVVKHVIAPEKFETAAQMPDTLTSWVADLPNLTTGDNMFNGCTGLTTFVGDLSSLTSGVGMFQGCTLDAESLEILAENLPTVLGGLINIGNQTNATDEVIAIIESKGWTISSVTQPPSVTQPSYEQ